MVMKRNSNKEYKTNTYNLLDRLVDGRIVDEGEMGDRMIIINQLRALLALPKKQVPTRVR
jgi:hypothetical protein